jgi:hypothetical protein
MTPNELARELHELIAALDRRVPHLERADETIIARDAAALRALAVQRLHELEAQSEVAGVEAGKGSKRKNPPSP